MKVENKSFTIGVDTQKEQKGYLLKQKNKSGGNIFAKNLNMQEDSITKKKKEAQQKAMKVISDTFGGEQKIDNDLKDIASHIDELTQNIKITSDEINEIEQEKASLKEKYGVADDSQEQKDLELLEKRRQSESGKKGNLLTKEEAKRLKEIDEAGITDYQKRSLELNQTKDPLLEQIEKSKDEIVAENAVIRGVNKERLKSSPMLSADKQADSIMDAASEEIIGMIVKEAKDNIDEEQKKKEEEAEKLKENKDKEEEFVDGVKEKLEELEKLVKPEEAEKAPIQEDILENVTEDILKLDNKKNDVKSEMEKIAEKMNLIMEDLKGAVVDSKL